MKPNELQAHLTRYRIELQRCISRQRLTLAALDDLTRHLLDALLDVTSPELIGRIAAIRDLLAGEDRP
jgi:hypothetical protein